MLSNKSFQSMPSFRAALSSLMCASPSTCPAKDTGKNTRVGQFQDMLGIEEGIKRRKEKKRGNTPVGS
jgi:hypothetical protein